MEKEFSAIQLLTNPAWVAVFVALIVNSMALIWGAGRLRQQQIAHGDRLDIAINDIGALRKGQQSMGERVANLEGRLQ